jgi:hypothetical protein
MIIVKVTSTENKIFINKGDDAIAKQFALASQLAAIAAGKSETNAGASEQVATEKAAQTVEDAASALASKQEAESAATDSGGFATNSGISATNSNTAKGLSEAAKVIAVEEAGKSSTSAGQSAASAAAAEAAKNQIVAINPLSVNSVGKINQANLFPSYITLFNHRNYPERPTASFPKSIILQNNILIGVSSNGTANGGISAYDLNGTNIWNRGFFPGNIQDYNDCTTSIIFLNNFIFTAGIFGSRFTKTSIDGVFNSNINLGTSRIRHHFVFGSNILTAVNVNNANNWVLRIYNDQLVQVGVDFTLPNIVTAMSVLGDSIYVGSANLVLRYDFSFNLLNTYTHNNGNTTLCPIFEESSGANINRIVIGVGNRALQFTKLTGTLITDYLINTLRSNIASYIYENDSYFFILNDGSVVYMLANTGILGVFGHNFILKLSSSSIGNIVVDGRFIYIATAFGIVKINNLL